MWLECFKIWWNYMDIFIFSRKKPGSPVDFVAAENGQCQSSKAEGGKGIGWSFFGKCYIYNDGNIISKIFNPIKWKLNSRKSFKIAKAAPTSAPFNEINKNSFAKLLRKWKIWQRIFQPHYYVIYSEWKDEGIFLPLFPRSDLNHLN